MTSVKRFLKRNCHNTFFKGLAGFGRSLNRFYENRNHDVYSNGELTILKKISKLNPLIIMDGGANTGDYSLSINQFIPDCTIYSFENARRHLNEKELYQEQYGSAVHFL